MSNKLSRVFDSVGEKSSWWIIILFFLFLVFQESFSEICITDWIPFLILLLIICSFKSEDNITCLDNKFDCEC